MNNQALITQELDRLKVNLQDIDSAKNYVQKMQEVSQLLESKIESIVARLENLATEIRGGFDTPYESLLAVISKGESDLVAAIERLGTQHQQLLDSNRDQVTLLNSSLSSTNQTLLEAVTQSETGFVRLNKEFESTFAEAISRMEQDFQGLLDIQKKQTSTLCEEVSAVNTETSNFVDEIRRVDIKQRVDKLESELSDVRSLVNSNISLVKNGISKSNKSIRTDIKSSNTERHSESKEIESRIHSLEIQNNSIANLTRFFRNTTWGAGVGILALLIYIAFFK